MINKIYGYIAVVVLFVLAIFGYRQKVRAETKEEIAEEQKDKIIEAAGDFHEIQAENYKLSDDDLRKRLFDKHGRR